MTPEAGGVIELKFSSKLNGLIGTCFTKLLNVP